MKTGKFLNSRFGAVVVLLTGMAFVQIAVSMILFTVGAGWVKGNFRILSEKSSDPNSFVAVQNIASGISGSIRKGFSSGSESPADKTMEFLECKKQVELRDIKMTDSGQKGLEKYLYKIVNHSDQHLSQIKINFTFYNDKGELVDAENIWISDIKVLEPGQEIAISGNRWLRKDKDSDEYQGASSSIKGQILSFDIVKMNQKNN